MKGSSFTFTAMGIATKKRGIYYSSPILENNSKKSIGVIVVKLDGEAIDSALKKYDSTIFLIDNRDFIFASNHEDSIQKPVTTVMKDFVVFIIKLPLFDHNSRHLSFV